MSSAAARWSRIVDRSHRSPLTLREFARHEGVNPNTLAWWRWRLRNQNADTARHGFAEVVVVDTASSQRREEGLVIQLGAARVEVSRASDLHLLRAVVEALT